MSRHSIKLFMWGYQAYFRSKYESLLNSVLRELGAGEVDGKCLLVGAKIPNAKATHDICVEPENGQWPVSLFAKLPGAIEKHIKNHPLKNVAYGDEPRMRDKPENIRRDSVRRAVQDALEDYDVQNYVLSFAGMPAPVGGYHVVPVLQIPSEIFKRFRPLHLEIMNQHANQRTTWHKSLIHAAISLVLSEAHYELIRPDPGRFFDGSASASEIVRRAASSFMYTLGVASGERSYEGWDLFERFNLISSLMYEGAGSRGRMLLAKLDSGTVDVALKLAKPVPFSEPRWVRKILQMASSDTALLANTDNILGLGDIAVGANPWNAQNVFEIVFHDHYHWSLSCGDEVLLVSRYGTPMLPTDKFPKVRLLDTFQRLFPEVTDEDIAAFTALFDAAVEQKHGSMLVVAKDAATEAARLSAQGTKIIPTKLTPELYRRVSNIDGTIIVDPKCICHAVGIILDGPAHKQCTPARGARYNSGIRYVAASDEPRLAIVVSDDRTVDVIPVLRPRVRKSAIEEQIARLKDSSVDTYHKPINWLDNHRFYLDQSQCDRINAEMRRLDNIPREFGELRILREDFTPNPGCTADYYEPESAV